MPDANTQTTVYNDNHACIDWSASVMSKGTAHLNLKENYDHEAPHLSLVKITHIAEIVNTNDLFTKELKDAAHFH